MVAVAHGGGGLSSGTTHSVVLLRIRRGINELLSCWLLPGVGGLDHGLLIAVMHFAKERSEPLFGCWLIWLMLSAREYFLGQEDVHKCWS